jgi:hypothetical protein
MSEYQFIHFLAVEPPLTDEQLEFLLRAPRKYGLLAGTHSVQPLDDFASSRCRSAAAPLKAKRIQVQEDAQVTEVPLLKRSRPIEALLPLFSPVTNPGCPLLRHVGPPSTHRVARSHADTD